MTKNLGPWTTAASAGSTAHLSTFWKRRLAMLPAAHRSSNRLGGRVVLFLLVAAALLWALPTLRESSVATTQAAGERSPATTAPTAKAASLTAKPPTLKNDSGAVASSEARATILKVNTPWLQPKTHPRSYIFSMKHTDKEDLWEAIVEFDSSAGVSVRPGPNSKERFDPYKGRLDANDFALLEGVSFYGPLHQAARSPDAYQVRVLGDGEVSGTEARVMHLRPAKPDEGTYPESLIRRPYPLRISCGCGIWELSYGSSQAAVEVDQIWVEKATGRVLREEGFVQGECRFLVEYGDYEKVSERAAVPRHVVVNLFSVSTDAPALREPCPWVFDMTFALHGGNAWLLKELTEWQAGKKVATAAVRDVKVAGAAGPGTAPQPALAAGKASEATREQAIAELKKAGASFEFRRDRTDEVLTVNLDHTHIGDDALTWISRIPETCYVRLEGTNVSDAGLVRLSPLGNLQGLDLAETGITDAGIEYIREHKNLRSLNLTKTKVTDAGMARLSPLADLEMLLVTDTAITDVGLKHIAEHPKLWWLDLAQTKISDAGLAELGPLEKLAYLMVTETGITDAGVKYICQHRTLLHLNLGGTKITDDAVLDLAKLPRLAELMLTGGPPARITDRALERLTPLRSLKKLYLNGTAVTDVGLRYLKELPNLDTIGLYWTGITDKGVEQLAEIKSLRHVNLNNTKITSAALDRLAPLPKLDHLEIRTNPGVSKAAVEAFRKAHPRCTVGADG